MPIEIREDGDVAVATLACPKGNAMNHAFIEALHEALDRTSRAEVRALVLTGKGRAFGAGLDLVESHALDRAACARFVDAFDDLFARLFTLPRPVIAAINGHAIAGGCVMACAADWRVMAAGDFSIGLTEVPLGIPFPVAAFECARYSIPRQSWAPCIVEGRTLTPYEALRLGVVERVVPGDEVLSIAVEKAKSLAALPAGSFGRTKLDLRAGGVARIRERASESRATFVEHWFGADATAKRSAMVASLTTKRPSAS
jgi:enoyl-CoA hydratase